MAAPSAIAVGMLAGALALVASAVWFHVDQPMPARGAGALLALGCVAALAIGHSGGWSWRRPVPWLLLALGYLTWGWTWTPVPDPATFRVVERAAALATLCGTAGWCLRYGHAPLALGAFGAVLLLTDVVGQCPWHDTTVGLALGLGLDPPFGNTNFTSGAALPLLAVGLLSRPATILGRGVMALGVVAALVLGTGALNGDANRAALVGLIVIAGMAGILWLPARWHGPLVLTAGLIGASLFAWLVVDEHYPALLGPSTGFRIGVWRAALAAWWEHPLLGHGPAASLTALNRQDDYQMAWLAVPGYAEHAHSEPLEVLVEGGLVLAGLLACAAVLLIAPLWRQRHTHAGLLTGWAVALPMACLESHYGQPGPLLCLAVLAGASLAASTPHRAAGVATDPGLRVVGLGACVAIVISLVGEFRWDVDGMRGHAAPPIAEVLGRRRLETERQANAWEDVLARAQRLQRTLGPLTDLWFVQAEAAAKAGHNRVALDCALRQDAVCPLLPAHRDLCDRLLRWAQKHHDLDAIAALEAGRRHARQLIERGQHLGWRGKDPKIATWLEAWSARTAADAQSPRDASPSSP